MRSGLQQSAGEDYIGPGTERAGDHKTEQAGDERRAAQGAVAPGDEIVEEEIFCHGDVGGGDLGGEEVPPQTEEKDGEDGEVGEDARGADEGEGSEASRDDAIGQLVEDEEEVFNGGVDVEFRITMAASAEGIADLGEADGATELVGAGKHVDEDFKAAAVEVVNDFKEVRAGEEEEAAHWVGDFATADGAGDFAAEL